MQSESIPLLVREHAAASHVGVYPRGAWRLANALGLPLRRSLAAAVLALPVLSVAAPTDCIGTSADGKLACVPPILSGWSYHVCRTSSLYIEEAKADNCAAAVGGYTWTRERNLRQFMTCMGATGGPSWVNPPSPGVTQMDAGLCGPLYLTMKYGASVTSASTGIGYSYGSLYPYRWKGYQCPAGYAEVSQVMPGDVAVSGWPGACAPTDQLAALTCETKGNPMQIANGDHNFEELEIPPSAGSRLKFAWHYYSRGYYRPATLPMLPGYLYERNSDQGVLPDMNLDSVGEGSGWWHHSYSMRLLPENAASTLWASVTRPNGRTLHFRKDGALLINEGGGSYKLTQVTEGTYTWWKLNTPDAIETYDASGKLLGVHGAQGGWVLAGYSNSDTLSSGSPNPTNPAGVAPGPNYLVELIDEKGRTLGLNYNAYGQLASVFDASHNLWQYTWPISEGNIAYEVLLSATDPMGRSKQFQYGDANGGPHALVGVIDELGAQYSTYGYRKAGLTGPSNKAFTQHANGAYRFEQYRDSSGNSIVTDPLGSTYTYGMVDNAATGVSRVATASQPAGAGCLASTSTRTFDANGNVASEDDFNGNRTCSVYDPSRPVATVRVEGLSNTATCSSVTPAGSGLPTGSRKITTSWHPNWDFRTRVAEPKKLTTYVYNGQPDPLNGNAIASCAAGGLLPGLDPLAVLCKKVEQATTDTNGSQGFAATIDGSVASAVTTFTYDAKGRMLTATDARGKTTTYTYYAADGANNKAGDLMSVSNPLGHAFTVLSYDPAGRILQTSDANNRVTTYSYDSMGRLLTVTTPEALEAAN